MRLQQDVRLRRNRRHIRELRLVADAHADPQPAQQRARDEVRRGAGLLVRAAEEESLERRGDVLAGGAGELAVGAGEEELSAGGARNRRFHARRPAGAGRLRAAGALAVLEKGRRGEAAGRRATCRVEEVSAVSLEERQSQMDLQPLREAADPRPRGTIYALSGPP